MKPVDDIADPRRKVVCKVALVVVGLAIASSAAETGQINDTQMGPYLRYSPGWTPCNGEHPRGELTQRPTFSARGANSCVADVNSWKIRS